MYLSEIVNLMQEAQNCHDTETKALLAELLLLNRIPRNESVAVEWLIDQILEDSKVIKTAIPTYDFAMWAQGTVLDCVDFLILSGAVDGPLVDIATESHLLLISNIKASDDFEKYKESLEEELANFKTNITE